MCWTAGQGNFLQLFSLRQLKKQPDLALLAAHHTRNTRQKDSQGTI